MNSKLQTVVTKFKALGRRIYHYRVLIGFCVALGIYGFVFWKIQTLNNLQPTDNQVSAQTNPTIGAHIDKHVVDQLQQLQDNSVSVKALFNQERSNPFQE